MLNTPDMKPVANRREAEAVARRQQILRHASNLFRLQGYRHTSLAEVIALSGGSRETLAKYFKNKAGLYAAVIQQGAIDFVEHSDLAALSGTPERVLCSYGELALQFFLRPAAMRTYRDVISEATYAPDVAAAFYRTGHRRLTEALAAKLRVWHLQGLVNTPDPENDADCFTHLLRSGIHEQLLLGLRSRPTQAEIKQKAADSVRLFLRGIGRSSF